MSNQGGSMTREKTRNDFHELVGLVFASLILVSFVVMFLTILRDLWPVFSLLFYGYLTRMTFHTGITAAMSLTGIALYVVSWPAVTYLGQWVGMPLFALGLLVWFYAVLCSLPFMFGPNVPKIS